MDIAFNLWDADVLGDGSSKGKKLTAYLDWEDEGLDTSKCASVQLSDDDYRAMADNPDTDDEWHYSKSVKHAGLMSVFIVNLVQQSKE